MSALTGTIIANTYKQLLQVGTGNVGLTNSLQTVQDGDANNSPLQLSNSTVNINGIFLLNGVDTTGSLSKITGGTGIILTEGGTSVSTVTVSGTITLNPNQSFGIVSATNIDTDELLMAGVSAANVTEVAAVSILTNTNLDAITSINAIIGDGTGFATDAELAAVSATMATSISNSNTNIAAVSVLTSVNLAAITSINGVIGDGSSFVQGPASSTDNALARFDSTTGKIIENSSAILLDTGHLGIGGTPSYELDVTGDINFTGTLRQSGTEFTSGGGLFKGDNGTTGNATNGPKDIFRINEQELNTNTTITASENASSTGPLNIASGVTLTVDGNLTII
jgi:hypothetical protein